jgi:hypothetical protein
MYDELPLFCFVIYEFCYVLKKIKQWPRRTKQPTTTSLNECAARCVLRRWAHPWPKRTDELVFFYLWINPNRLKQKDPGSKLDRPAREA